MSNTTKKWTVVVQASDNYIATDGKESFAFMWEQDADALCSTLNRLEADRDEQKWLSEKFKSERDQWVKSWNHLDKMYQELKAAPRSEVWISVKERLPKEDEDGVKVLLYRNTTESQKPMAMSIHDSFLVKHCDTDTFWMQLPNPPQQTATDK